MTATHRLFHDRIVSDPTILVGKPTIRGTRISVELVLDHLRVDPDIDAFLRSYPHLTIDDVRACLDYAYALVMGEEVRPVSPANQAESHAP